MDRKVDEMLDAIKEFYTRCQQVTQIAEATAPHMVHKTMVYQCTNRFCHNYYIMRIEKGLEDPRTDDLLGENHKPVPFAITCPECLSRADHVFWSLDQNYEYKELEEKTNFFINLPNEDCGIPVIYRPDAHTFAKVCDILGIKLPPVKGTEVNSITIDDFAGLEDFPGPEPEVFAFGRGNRKSRRHGNGVIFDERRYIRPKKGQSKYF